MANASKMRIKELQTALGKMGVSTRGMLEKAELVDAYVGALRDGKRPDAAAAGDDVFDDDVVELKTSKMPKAGGGPQPPPAGGSPTTSSSATCRTAWARRTSASSAARSRRWRPATWRGSAS